MTRKLYLDDGYQRSFDAVVTGSESTESGWEVTLAETCFYPESGGQPADRGQIGGVAVVDVQLRGGEVIHLLDREPPESPAHAEINWLRRYDFMQQHTGQHLLTAALIQLYEAYTVGFHLGERISTIDITLPGLNADRRRKAEELCGEWIVAAIPTTVEYVEAEEFRRMELRKKALPEDISGAVRLLRIGEVDVAHCGGTHLRSTAEIRLIKIIGVEKVRDTTRLHFLAGQRAVDDYAEKHGMLSAMAVELTCGIEDLPARIAGLRSEAKESSKQLRKLRGEMIENMAPREAADAVEAGAFKVLARRYDGWDAGELKTLAGAVTAAESRLLLCAGGGDAEKAILVLAAGAEFKGDLGEAMKELLPAFGGKGGGRGNFAQAAGNPARLDAAIEAALKLLKEIGENH